MPQAHLRRFQMSPKDAEMMYAASDIDAAKEAWIKLGRKMGFDPLTAQRAGNDETKFLAVPVAKTVKRKTPSQSPPPPVVTELSKRLISIKVVMDRTSLSRSSIYREMSAGRFPKCVPLTSKRTAWI